MRQRLLYYALFFLAVGAAGCTPGAATGGASAQIAGATLVHLSLIKFTATSSNYGTLAGYNPAVITVARGAIVQFVNDDTFPHTATSLGTSGFPAGSPLTTAALTPSAQPNDLAQTNWSTGELQGGAFSQTFTASQTGTYYFGCYYHYSTPGSPMRGVIVVQ